MTVKMDSGIEEILRNLNASLQEVGRGIHNGLKRAGLHLQAKSQEIVPVDKGILKNTAYTRPKGQDEHTEVFVGYTAEYAVYVHEDLKAVHGTEYNQKYFAQEDFKARGPDQQAKFLERPMREERRQMLALVEDSIKRNLRRVRKS